MVTRILAVVSALLAALVVHQYSQIGQLRAEVANAEERGAMYAQVVDGEFARGAGTGNSAHDVVAERLLQGPRWAACVRQGLWIDGHPDYEGLSVWVFTVYLPRRLRGDSEEQARQAVVDAIKQSEEWQVKHKG